MSYWSQANPVCGIGRFIFLLKNLPSGNIFLFYFNGYKVSITSSNYLQSEKEKGDSIIRTTRDTECTGAKEYCFV